MVEDSDDLKDKYAFIDETASYAKDLRRHDPFTKLESSEFLDASLKEDFCHLENPSRGSSGDSQMPVAPSVRPSGGSSSSATAGLQVSKAIAKKK